MALVLVKSIFCTIIALLILSLSASSKYSSSNRRVMTSISIGNLATLGHSSSFSKPRVSVDLTSMWAPSDPSVGAKCKADESEKCVVCALSEAMSRCTF